MTVALRKVHFRYGVGHEGLQKQPRGYMHVWRLAVGALRMSLGGEPAMLQTGLGP